MTRFLDRWDRLPGVLRLIAGVLASAALFLVAFNVCTQAFGAEEDDTWAILVSLLVLSAALIGFGLARANQRLGGRGQLRRYHQALRTGQVPPGVDAGRWRPLVAEEQVRIRRGLRVLVVVWAVLLVGVTAAMVAAPVLAEDPAAAVLVFAPSFVLAVLGWWALPRLWRRRRDQLDRLAEKLST